MIKLIDISFAYPGQAALFDGLKLELSTETRTLIRGENGSGKSTLMQLITGNLQPQKGELIHPQHPGIFYVPQDAKSRILGVSLEQDLRLWQIAGLKTCVQHLASQPLLQDFDPAIFSKPIRELSTGTLQAYMLALALLHQEHYLILDEALPSLDEQRRQLFCRELAKVRGFLAVSHESFGTEPAFDHILTLKEGKLL